MVVEGDCEGVVLGDIGLVQWKTGGNVRMIIKDHCGELICTFVPSSK